MKNKFLSTFLLLGLSAPLFTSCGGSGPDPVVYHKLSFKGTNCCMKDEIGGQISEKDFEAGMTASFHLEGIDEGETLYDNPTAKNVKLTYTATGEPFDGTYSYDEISGSISVKMAADVTITATGEASKPGSWSTKSDWWNYCSNNVRGERATRADIGKTLKVTVNGLDHDVRLIGLDHDELASKNGAAHCTFEFANLITDSDGYVKSLWDNTSGTSTKNYNFPNSTLNKFLNGDSTNPTATSVLDMLPDELKNSIKEVNKYVGVSSDSGKNYLAESYQTKLFPLAAQEIIDGEPSFITEGEGTLYQYYEAHSEDNERIKRPVNATAESYWLRTPNTYYEDSAFCINYNGYVYGTSTVYSTSNYGIAPAFCI